MDYVSSSDVFADMPDAGISQSTDANDLIAIGNFITSASRMIDGLFGMPDNFFASTDETTREFDGSGTSIQPIDRCHTLTSVSVAESGGTAVTDYTAWVEDTDFYTWPVAHASKGVPITELWIEQNGNHLHFPRYRKSVKVTGVFGYSATPPDVIKQAVKMQTIIWYMRAKQAYQQQGANGAVAGMLTFNAVKLDNDVQLLLKKMLMEFMV